MIENIRIRYKARLNDLNIVEKTLYKYHLLAIKFRNVNSIDIFGGQELFLFLCGNKKSLERVIKNVTDRTGEIGKILNKCL